MSLPHAVTVVHNALIIMLERHLRLPAFHAVPEQAHARALVAYGPNLGDLFRRTAEYVDPILRGEKPGDLPVQEPTTFELIINLRTARALGLSVSSALPAGADEMIE